ncbi:hypothetical protein [Lysinibacillus cavernae]|uniref:hypothetical protein n=1 Tax=Lysinibacillus cavernae TaxID=2666135 RepID=UPI0012D8596D|nr:hypothetical protein [Lysinibacillus cavernae]
MNTIKGSFYILFQSYKKQNIIFWSILFSIVLLSFFLDTFFGQYISFAITISIPVYIFYSLMAAKLLNRTLPYFLKLGVSRQQYLLNVGLFFISASLVGALIIASAHKIIVYISNLLNVKDIIIIHPILFFNNAHSFLQTVAMDTVLLLFCLSSGLLLNVVFYRLGILGGYSFIGLLVLIPIIMVIFQWYSPLFNLFANSSIFAILGCILVFSVLLYLVITAFLRKISVSPV